MLRRFVSLGAGALALLVVLGAPRQVHAQHRHGGGPHGVRPVVHGGMRTPGFRRGFDPRFDHRFFDRRFDPRFNRRFDRRFDRFEDRFENRSNRGFFGPLFVPGFGPTFIRPF